MSPAPEPVLVLAELHVVPPDAEIVLTGEVDLHGLDQVRSALATVVACPVQHLTIDLSRTEFVSLGVLSEVAAAGSAVVERGGTVVLSGARPVQRRILGLLDVPAGMVLADADG